MKQISSTVELKQAIAELERKTKSDEITIKDQFLVTKQALKPKTVLRNSFSSLAQQPEIRKTIISTLIGFGLGYFSKKATAAMSEESLNRLVGAFVEHGLNTVVEKNPDSLLAKGIHLTRHVAKEKGLKFY